MIRTLAAALAASVFACACTLDAGHGFATMKDGELHVALEPSEARDLGDGAFLTDQGYRIQPREISLRIEHVAVLELRGVAGGESASFDPANPPAGFGNCHGGHCHADDGRLVAYEDVQAMAAGGGSRLSPLATAHVDRSFDLLEGERAPLSGFEPSAELPQGSLDRLEIALTHVRMRADAEHDELAQPIAIEVDLPLSEPLTRTLSLEIDRDGPDEIALAIDIRFDATVLDGVDLASWVEAGAVSIDEDAVEAGAAISEWLARAEIEVAF